MRLLNWESLGEVKAKKPTPRDMPFSTRMAPVGGLPNLRSGAGLVIAVKVFESSRRFLRLHELRPACLAGPQVKDTI